MSWKIDPDEKTEMHSLAIGNRFSWAVARIILKMWRSGNMYKALGSLLAFCLCCATAAPTQTHQHGQPHRQSTSENPDAHGKPVKVVGYVRDAFCLMKNPQAGAATDAESRSCMRKCIQAGSPLVILG